MEGRFEHELAVKNRIEKKLKGKHQSVIDYYYNLQISKEAKTCENYIDHVLLFLNYINKNPKKITSADIGRYFNHIQYLTNKDGSKRKSSASYKRLAWSSLNSFFTYLLKSNQIKSNPIELTQRPKTQHTESNVFLSMEDLNKILKAVDEMPYNGGHKYVYDKWRKRDKLIMYLLMSTGMRRNALTEINCEDIDTNEMILTVIDKRSKVQKYPITPELLNLLNDWIGTRNNILSHSKVDTSALFITQDFKRISAISVYNIVKRYSMYAIGREISPHKLRAAFVTLYYEASGHDIHATCLAVGHANIATTSIYIRRQNDARTDAVNFMSKNLLN